MPRVIHFEIPAANAEKVVKFYSDLFDWKIQKWGSEFDYWLVTTGEAPEMGIDGAITPKQGPFQTTVNTIGVGNIDEYIEKAQAAGGKMVGEKTAIEGIGYVAYFTDPDGNMFGIHEPNTHAKYHEG